MGDDLSTGAKIGIGLVILCFLIAIVLSLLLVVKNITNSGANQMESGLSQMMATTYDDYDQQIVTGTKVNSAVKLFSGESIAIVVVTGLCQDNNIKGGYCYGYLLDSYTQSGTAAAGYSYSRAGELTKADPADTYYTEAPVSASASTKWNLNTKPMSESGTNQYVRDNGKFLAELIKDTTGTIIGISFTQMVT